MKGLFENWNKYLNEDPIKRIGDPSYAQKIYGMTLKLGIQKKRGGDREETFTEIRGIPSVTVVTVDPTGTSRDKDYYYSTINCKIELVQNENPLRYLKYIFLPGLRKIKGLRILHIGQIRDITT